MSLPGKDVKTVKNQKGETLTVTLVLLKGGEGELRKKWLRFFAITLAVFLLAGTVAGAQVKPPIQKDESIRRGETRPTLDPKLFRDARVRTAYQVAKEIPWVLDSIYCYCFCAESLAFKHKSLLSCYVDDHAAG